MGQFFYGVIEGFYGRQWSWTERLDYAPFLAETGFDCYIYAPKGESGLRSHWRQPLQQETFCQLQQLAQRYRQLGLRWGVGLSPLGLGESCSADDLQQLAQKVSGLGALDPDILCILFDDMRGDVEGLAQRQLQIVDTILEHSCARQHILCPTYYSFDPVLEQVFGTMPDGYWRELGEGLPADVGIFWTGNRVISESLAPGDIERATAALGRRPILWDNYPVNDGRKTCGHLHLRPYRGRPAALRELTEGHLVNPMSQPWLSRLVLQSLQLLYRRGMPFSEAEAWQRGLALLGDAAFAQQLSGDLELFQDRGLETMPEELRASLAERYAQFSHPAAAEIVDWLGGGYEFDPACLTG